LWCTACPRPPQRSRQRRVAAPPSTSNLPSTRTPRSYGLIMSCLARLRVLDAGPSASFSVVDMSMPRARDMHAGSDGAQARHVDGQRMVHHISLSPRAKAKESARRDHAPANDCTACNLKLLRQRSRHPGSNGASWGGGARVVALRSAGWGSPA